MRYALIIAGYALILWGIYTIRRDAGRGRAASYRDGQAEVEAVVEEFVAAAERVRVDLERKSAELQRMINLADDRLAKLIQAQAPAPSIVANTSAAPAAPVPPTAQATSAAAAPQASDSRTPAETSPSMATRGRAAAAASYRAQASDSAPVGQTAGHAQEAQAVRATLAGGEKGAKAEHIAESTEQGEKKARKGRTRHAEVYELADAGQGVTEIARVTGLSKGEVQLILDLRKTR